jgi:hypothetical protein
MALAPDPLPLLLLAKAGVVYRHRRGILSRLQSSLVHQEGPKSSRKLRNFEKKIRGGKDHREGGEEAHLVRAPVGADAPT